LLYLRTMCVQYVLRLTDRQALVRCPPYTVQYLISIIETNNSSSSSIIETNNSSSSRVILPRTLNLKSSSSGTALVSLLRASCVTSLSLRDVAVHQVYDEQVKVEHTSKCSVMIHVCCFILLQGMTRVCCFILLQDILHYKAVRVEEGG
jgi:hypothetical protein